MPCIYDLVLPARRDVDEKQVLLVLKEWVNNNQFNSFKDIGLGEDISFAEGNFHIACAESELQFFHLRNPLRIAVRSSTSITQTRRKDRLPANLLWEADFIAEESVDGLSFRVRLHRSAADPSLPCSVNVPVWIPGILSLLVEKDLLGNDAGLPFSLAPLKVDSVQKRILDNIISGKVLTHMPVVLVPLREEAFANDLSHRICGAAHIILSQSAGEISVIFPRISVKRAFPVQNETVVEDVFYYILWATLAASVTRERTTFEEIERISAKVSPTSGETLSEYIFTSPKLGELLRAERVKKGLTQADLGKLVGSSGLIISRLERSELTRVQRSFLTKLERELDMVAGMLVSSGEITPPSKRQRLAPKKENGSSAASVFCHSCGNRLREGAAFCHSCGTRVLP